MTCSRSGIRGRAFPGLLLPALMLAYPVATSATNPITNFSDVLPKSKYYPTVSEMGAKFITVGTNNDGSGNGTFGVADYITRGQMTVFIIRALNYAFRGAVDDWYQAPDFPYNYKTAQFDDVGANRLDDITGKPVFPLSGGHPYFPWVQKMGELGLTVGCGGAGHFCVDGQITWGQMAVFAMRAWQLRVYGQGSTSPLFPPPTGNHYPALNSSATWFDTTYIPFIQKAFELGFFTEDMHCSDEQGGPTVTPTPNNGSNVHPRFCVNDPITRGDASYFIVRAIMGELTPTPGRCGDSLNASTFATPPQTTQSLREYIHFGGRTVATENMTYGGGAAYQLRVNPFSPRLRPGETLTFTVSPLEPVSWSIVCLPNQNCTNLGSIGPNSGVYTAPSTVSQPLSVTILATDASHNGPPLYRCNLAEIGVIP